MTRTILTILLGALLLACAGTADAAKGHGGRPDEPGPPAHANAHGRAAELEPQEAAPGAEEPTAEPPSAPAAPPRAEDTPAAPAHTRVVVERPDDISPPPRAEPELSFGSVFVPAPPRDEAPEEAVADASPTRALRWALPLVGLGVGVVVLARRRLAAETPVETPAPADDLAALLKRGQAAAARGATAEAATSFDRALALAPTLAVAHFCKGVCLADAGRPDDALPALRAAVECAPEEPSYRIHLARVAAALGQAHEAMSALEPVLAAMPELGAAVLDDETLAPLRDHPRFLAMVGAL